MATRLVVFAGRRAEGGLVYACPLRWTESPVGGTQCGVVCGFVDEARLAGRFGRAGIGRLSARLPGRARPGFELLAGSPCIDSGYSGEGVLATDIDGNARVDDASTTNAGSGPFAFWDIGPHELQ